MKMRVLVRGRDQCSECQGLGYSVQRNEAGLLVGHVCNVCRGDGDHPSVLLVPCVDVRR